MDIPCLDYLFNSPATVNRGLVFFKEMDKTFHLHSYWSFRYYTLFSAFSLVHIANSLRGTDFGSSQKQILTKEESCFSKTHFLPLSIPPISIWYLGKEEDCYAFRYHVIRQNWQPTLDLHGLICNLSITKHPQL